MPQAITTPADLRSDLAAMVEYDLTMARSGFIADLVLPVTEVMLASDEYSVIPIEQLLRENDDSRAEGAGYGRDDIKFDVDSYICTEHGLEGALDDRATKRYRDLIDAEMHIVNRTKDTVLRNREKRVADLIFNTTTWTGSALTTDGSDWTTYNTATPVQDVEGAIRKVRDNSGQMPNALILPWLRYRDLRFCDEIVDRLKYHGHTDVTPSKIVPSMLAEVFDLDRVIVAGAQRNSANEAVAASLTDTWDPTMAMIAHIATGDDFAIPCIGRTFHWNEDGSMGTMGATIESYRDESRRSTIYRYRMDVAEKVIRVECGHLLTGLTS